MVDYIFMFYQLSNSSLVLILHIWFSFVGPNILLKIFLSKTSNFWITVSFNTRVSEAYVTTGPRSTLLFHTTAHTKTRNRISQVSISILKSVILTLISFRKAGFVASCADIAFKNKLLNDRYKTREDEEKDVSSYWTTLRKKEGKAVPLQVWTGPAASRKLRFPDFKTIGTWRWHARQPYAPAAFNSQEIFLVFIAIRVWVNPRVIVWPEGLCQWKIPMTPSGIEPATFRLVQLCLHLLRHRVTLRKRERWYWKCLKRKH